MGPIYLDHHAATPPLPEAEEAMRAAALEAFGNPASSHRAGRRARQALEGARETVARLLDAHPDEVTFTSGATEANNLALFGLAGEPGPAARLLAGRIEHPCVVEPLERLRARGFALDWLPVSARGVVEVAAVAGRAAGGVPRLVSVMLANHETGAIQPVRDIVAALPAGVAVHCDAAQAVGKIPVSFRGLGVSALALSAHKFRGPKGIGALLLKRGTELRPLLLGGHQQGGRRPGTEAAALAVGMAAALEHAVRYMAETSARLRALRARLWERLRTDCAPAVNNGPGIGEPDALPTALNVSFPGCRADVLMMALDLAGVACSTGSACSSGSLLPSPVLAAMGVPDGVLLSAMRFTLGPTSTESEIDEACRRIAGCVVRTRE